MFGQLLPNKNEQVTIPTVLREISRRQLGDQLNVAKAYLQRNLVSPKSEYAEGNVTNENINISPLFMDLRPIPVT